MCLYGTCWVELLQESWIIVRLTAGYSRLAYSPIFSYILSATRCCPSLVFISNSNLLFYNRANNDVDVFNLFYSITLTISHGQ